MADFRPVCIYFIFSSKPGTSSLASCLFLGFKYVNFGLSEPLEALICSFSFVDWMDMFILVANLPILIYLILATSWF